MRILQRPRELSKTASYCLFLTCFSIMALLLVISSVSKCIFISIFSIASCMILPLLIFPGWKRGRILNSTKSCAFDRTVHKCILVLGIILVSWGYFLMTWDQCLPTWAAILYIIILTSLTIPPLLFAYYKTKDMKEYVDDRTERIRQLCDLVHTESNFSYDVRIL